jgi:hypothetical protein
MNREDACSWANTWKNRTTTMSTTMVMATGRLMARSRMCPYISAPLLERHSRMGKGVLRFRSRPPLSRRARAVLWSVMVSAVNEVNDLRYSQGGMSQPARRSLRSAHFAVDSGSLPPCARMRPNDRESINSTQVASAHSPLRSQWCKPASQSDQRRLSMTSQYCCKSRARSFAPCA